MPAIIYFDYSYEFTNYLGERIKVEDKDRRFLKLGSFDNEEELKSWVEKTEREIAKEICEKVSYHRSNVNVYITNIVRV
jgi:hypothetical protein